MGYLDFPAEEIKLSRIYRSEATKGFENTAFRSGKIEEVYGELSFPPFPREHSYTFGSFVCSIDGRIAFPESPDGTLVAKSNRYDTAGGLCDFWILTMLRAVSDAVLMGSLTIKREPELTARIADRELEGARRDSGREAVPLHVVVTKSGKNLPLDHTIFRSEDIPSLVVTSESGRELLLKKISELYEAGDYRDIGAIHSARELNSRYRGETKYLGDPGGRSISIVGLGEDDNFDVDLLLRFLKLGGIDSMLVESPTFLVSLMREGLLNELYLNHSGLFVGGDALSIGDKAAAFTTEDHPHSRTLSIHSHGDHFFYTRYALLYD